MRKCSIGGRIDRTDRHIDTIKPLLSNSQFGQDIWVVSLFNGKRNGFFMEIGGGDGVWISNTLLLEREFGWNGILVEPTSAFDQLIKNRPNCITDNACIASERKIVTLFEILDRGQELQSGQALGNSLLSMVREDLSVEEGQRLNSQWGKFQKAYQRQAIPLADVLRKHNAPRVIDYFSLDVEGFEFEILKNFPFGEYVFLCLGVERPSTELQALLEANGYRPKARLGEDVMYLHASMTFGSTIGAGHLIAGDKTSDRTSSHEPPIRFVDTLALKNPGQQTIADPFEAKVIDLLSNANVPLAEMQLRMLLAKEPGNAKALNFLGWIADAVKLPHFAVRYLSEAVKQDPQWQLALQNLVKAKQRLEAESAVDARKTARTAQDEKFLLIKAWGYGFWSDVSHVLGQFLIAEITGRIPVVHWGSNSLFSDGSDSNSFAFYFKAPSEVGIADLQRADFDFWPPKWNCRNLTENNLHKWSGPFSRLAGLYFLSRPEKVVVSDFHTAVNDIRPWIPIHHHLFGLSIDQLYQYLVRRYLHPRNSVVQEVEDFCVRQFASASFIAVHARGSDKIVELRELDELNKRYKGIVDRYRSLHGCDRIFLMTDDARIRAQYVEMFGDAVVTTDCRRTDSAQGIHYQSVPDRPRLGTEVMVDAYVAARAKAFVGNGSSNPSLMVRYLKDWPEEDFCLIGQNAYHSFNTFLHEW